MANYYRLSVRFKKSETLKKLRAFKKEVERDTRKHIPMSRFVETIVEQFLDKQVLSLLEEEKE